MRLAPLLLLLVCAATRGLAEDHPAPPPLPVPDDVQCVENLPYRIDPAADPLRHRVDLYLPRSRTNFPTLVFVHGGGYQRGDRSVGHNLGVVLAHHGAAVASISYRLFPQVRHPGHIQDVARAVAWARLAMPAFGGDPRRIFVGGHSAGTHLAALLGTDGSYLATEGLERRDLAGVLAISGGYRINPIRKDVFGDEAAMAKASPFAHLTGDHPPFLLLVGSLEKTRTAPTDRGIPHRPDGRWHHGHLLSDPRSGSPGTARPRGRGRSRGGGFAGGNGGDRPLTVPWTGSATPCVRHAQVSRLPPWASDR